MNDQTSLVITIGGLLISIFAIFFGLLNNKEKQRQIVFPVVLTIILMIMFCMYFSFPEWKIFAEVEVDVDISKWYYNIYSTIRSSILGMFLKDISLLSTIIYNICYILIAIYFCHIMFMTDRITFLVARVLIMCAMIVIGVLGLNEFWFSKPRSVHYSNIINIISLGSIVSVALSKLINKYVDKSNEDNK